MARSEMPSHMADAMCEMAAPLTANLERVYVLQDCRSNTGNCMMFWRAGGHGYTSDLNEAGLFTYQEAVSQEESRPGVDRKWRIEYLRTKVRNTVDFQTVDVAESRVQGWK